MLNYIKDKEAYPFDAEKYIMPMPLKAAMLSNNSLATKMRDIVKVGDSHEKDDDEKITWQCFTKTNAAMRQQIQKIVRQFDYILTTNYSYEIEMSLLDTDDLTPEKIAKLMNYHEINHAQTQFLINTFNLVDSTPIWHIHGEARKPDSMIIGSAYYGKLLRRCVERIDGPLSGSREKTENKRTPTGKEQEFKRNIKMKRPQKIGSWIDAFVLGNVYILGLGMDFSEADLWWLVDYKANNSVFCGKTFYFEPKHEARNNCIADMATDCPNVQAFIDGKKCRDFLLDTYQVVLDDLNVMIHNKEDYKAFYGRAIQKISLN